ncbi:MAG: hypothetical protein ACP5UV_03070 [Thermoplasmata archaeon]
MTDEEMQRGKEILEKLKDGKWPSHVTQTEKTRYPMMLYGVSLSEKRDLWTTGGYVSVPGAPTGILMRVTSRNDIGENANVVRIYIPSGNFVKSDFINKICDYADNYGVGMVHAITTSHNIEIPGIPKEKIREFIDNFKAAGFDVGSTGDAFRNTTTCVGPIACEYANTDAPKWRDDFYDNFYDYAKYPTFPHKMKFKVSGCPLDCARATQKADIGVVASWEGSPEIVDNNFSESELSELKAMCPTDTLGIDGKKLKIMNDQCNQCMKCIRNGYGKIAAGRNKVFLVYVGGKLRGKRGPFTGKLLKKVHTEDEVFDLINRAVNAYVDHAARKERIGDMIYRIGWKQFLALIDEKTEQYQIKDPRSNVFIKVTESEKEKMKDELEKGGN